MLREFTEKGKWISAGALALVIGVINQSTIQQMAIGVACLIIFFVCTSALFGSRLVQDQDVLIQIGIGLGAVGSLLAIGGSAIYYLGAVERWMLCTLCLIVLLIGACIGKSTSIERSTRWIGTKRVWIALISIIICIAAWWRAIASTDIQNAVRSVWLVVDPAIMISLALAIILTIVIVPHVSIRIRLSLLTLILLSVWIVPILTYSLGYGFDPFIHRATVSYIAEFGTITPKPFYYIGQYALELIAQMLFGVSIYMIDMLLVPVLGAIMLGASGVYGFALTTRQRGWAALSLLLLPLGAFITTTPQSLAYVFTGTLIFLSLPVLARNDHQPPRTLLILLAIAALVTHPLAGIPACLYTACVFAVTNRKSTAVQGSLLTPIVISSVVAIPAVFLVQAARSGLAISFSLTNLAWEQLAVTGFWRNQFSSIFDGLYLFIDNQLWIALALALLGAWLLKKKRADVRLHLPLMMVLIWIINYLILTLTLQFDFLIEYERSDYAQRLLTISLLFLIPHIAFAIDGIFDHLQNRARALRLGWTILLAGMIVTGVYGAFPRHDNYARSAGFNVSTTDFDAAIAIHELGGDQPYIVLANQAVSAAALELYGFKQYYHSDIFYYPIPTGGELYSYYLQMADEKPTREVMIEAMDLTGVDLGFFVLNDYWWDANRIAEAAKKEADSWFGVGSGDNAITVFVFKRDTQEDPL